MSLSVVAFTSHLKSVRRSGKGWVALCPCHDDCDPSLSLQEKDGKVLFTCHAGCPQSDLVTFFRKAGVLQGRAPGAFPESFRGQLITERYTYTDEAGKPLFYVCRTAGKEFPLHSPEGKWGRNGARLVLYNLQAVLKAESVFVVEGEKDVDKLTRMQLVGTTSPGGAGKWRPEFSQHLKGRNVVIIPDNDEPGRKHAEQVTAGLHSVAESVKILELPNLPDHGDLSDWVKGRLPSDAAEDLCRLAEGAAPAEGTAHAEEPDSEDENHTDLGNARRLVELHGDDMRYVPVWGWLIWDGRRFKKDEEGRIDRLAKDTVRSIYGEATRAPDSKQRQAIATHAKRSEARSRIMNMIALAKTEPEVVARPEDFDRDPWLLNCQNGTLDLKTGELRQHCREDLITKLAPVTYDPTAPAPLWEKFLARIMNDNQDLIEYLKRCTGYCLTGLTTEQCMFILYGLGNNGKTTAVEPFRTMLGDYAAHTPSETLLAKKGADAIPSDIARLPGKRLVTASETEDNKRLSENQVKQLTGGDTIAARFLYREWFEFQPQFKLILCTNHKPRIHGQDVAIWRRIRLVPFTATITKEERDPAMAEKLQAELAGILAWAVRGCLDWQRVGLNEPTEVRGATAEYKRESDVLGEWIEDCCVILPTAKAPYASLYRSYKVWCEGFGHQPLSSQRFGRLLTERGFPRTRSAAARAREGIGLR